jgi:FAD/FMN-containing dehydrogenase
MSRLAECVVETEKDFAKSRFGVPPIVGHAGDGNFHVMVRPRDAQNQI